MEELSNDQRQHLAFIQDVITRMNSNSFSLKGLMITIFSALSVFFVGNYDKDTAVIYLALALLLVVIFWLLDTYYLKMEKQYRMLYEDAIKNKVEIYKMTTDKYYVCYFEVLLSKTMWPLYFPIVVVLIVAIVIKVLNK